MKFKYLVDRHYLMPKWAADFEPLLKFMQEHPEYPFEWLETNLLDDYSYWKSTMAHWGEDDFIQVDADKKIEKWHMEEILNCPERDCAFVYVCSLNTKDPFSSVFNPKWGVQEKDFICSPVNRADSDAHKSQKWSFGAASGFWKLSKQTQLMLEDKTPVTFLKGVDVKICGRLMRSHPEWKGFHLHRYVEHLHYGIRDRFK